MNGARDVILGACLLWSVLFLGAMTAATAEARHAQWVRVQAQEQTVHGLLP